MKQLQRAKQLMVSLHLVLLVAGVHYCMNTFPYEYTPVLECRGIYVCSIKQTARPTLFFVLRDRLASAAFHTHHHA